MQNANSSTENFSYLFQLETVPDAFLVINDDISFDHPFGIHIFDACLHQFSILARMVHSILSGYFGLY